MKDHRRGFTLVEMIIAITVAVIVFGMVTTFCVGISNFSREKTIATEIQEELARAERFMHNWVKTLDDAFNSNFAVTDDNREVRIKSSRYRWNEGYYADNHLALYFDEESGVMTADYLVSGEKDTRTEIFDRIKTVRFARGDDAKGVGNVVKCVLTVKDDDTVHTIILHKSSSSAKNPIIFSKPHEITADNYHEFVFVSSADWEDVAGDNEVAGYVNLQDLVQYTTYNLTAAYQYATLSLIQVQLDDGARMSLEAFVSLYDRSRVRIFPAGGKVAYGLALHAEEFGAANHKVGFFINEGSTLYDGTPVEAMGYVREKGLIGTKDWRAAATLSLPAEKINSDSLVLTFQTDVRWTDASRQIYTDLEFENVGDFYGLSKAECDGIQNGILITVGYETCTLKEFQAFAKAAGAAKEPVSVRMLRTEPEGYIQLQLLISKSALESSGGIYKRFGSLTEKTAIITFEEHFLLPGGIPLKEKLIFARAPAALGNGVWKQTVLVTALPEQLDGLEKPIKGNDLASYTTFTMEFKLHTPWTDTTRTAYENLQVKDTAQAAYGLSDDFFTNLYNYVFIGRKNGEYRLGNCMNDLKLSVSLRRSADGNTILRFDFPTAQMVAAGYPIDITGSIVNVRFGSNGLENNRRTCKFVCLPDGTPLTPVCFAREPAPACEGRWAARYLFIPSPKVEAKNGSTFVTMSINGMWPARYALRYDNLEVAANWENYPLPESFAKSLREKLFVVIDGQKETLSAFNGRTYNAISIHTLNTNGCFALQLEIKEANWSYVDGKTFSVVYENGFVSADGSTLLVPMTFTRSSSGKWTVTYG